MNSAVLANREGACSIGSRPPAFVHAQLSSSTPTMSNTGALAPCRSRTYSIPRRMTARLTHQKAKKQMPTEYGTSRHAGQSVASRLLIASPPIQVWMPNQPQATSARARAGMLAPRTPNEARARMGKGIP